jgi:hypothetical protein
VLIEVGTGRIQVALMICKDPSFMIWDWMVHTDRSDGFVIKIEQVKLLPKREVCLRGGAGGRGPHSPDHPPWQKLPFNWPQHDLKFGQPDHGWCNREMIG